jgi:Fe-S-cluster formation regulator IscX/YfhJ
VNGTTALRPPTLPVREADPDIPPSTWEPPGDVDDLKRLFQAVQNWEPVDWKRVNEGLDTVLGDDDHPAAFLPDPATADKLAQDFRSALTQLVNRALRDAQRAEADPETVRLLSMARKVRVEELPDDPGKALGLLRRLGSVTSDLVESLEQLGVVEGVSEC